MALSSSSSALCLHSATVVTGSQFSTPQLLFPSRVSFSYFPTKLNNNYQNNRNLSSTEYYHSSASQKWRASVSFFPAFLNKGKDAKVLKEELLEAIAPLDRGAEATPEDQQRVEQIARKLEGVNPTKEPLKSDLLNGKWELIYTTSQSILQTQRPRFLRSVRNYQAINVDTLRAQNLESGPFFNQITTIRLNEGNFQRWSQSVRMYIRGRGKIGYLTGDVKAPEISDPSYGVWDAENSMIMAWLVNSMDEDIGANYMCYSTAKELWDNVSQMYSDYGNQSQIYELQLALGDIRQGDYSITKYFNTLKRLWQDLDLFNDYEWESMEDFKHHKQTVNNERIFKFLAGLNVEFDEVRGRIIGRKPLPTLEDVFSEVRREESRRGVMLGKKNSVVSVEKSALVTADANATRSITQQQQKPRVWCDYCNKPRHTREACWKLHGKPADWKNSKHSRASANEVENLEKNLSKEQIAHLIKLLTSNPPPSTPSGSLAQTG